MITLLHNYIRAHNIVEFSAYLIALLYILDAFTWNGERIEIIHHGRYTPLAFPTVDLLSQHVF